MKNSNKLIGTQARLPDGTLVKIKKVYSDGYATVKRLRGEWKGMSALCRIDKLLPA